MSQPLVVADNLVLRIVRREGRSGDALVVRLGEVERQAIGRETEPVHRNDAGVALVQRLREGHGDVRAPVNGLRHWSFRSRVMSGVASGWLFLNSFSH